MDRHKRKLLTEGDVTCWYKGKKWDHTSYNKFAEVTTSVGSIGIILGGCITGHNIFLFPVFLSIVTRAVLWILSIIPSHGEFQIQSE